MRLGSKKPGPYAVPWRNYRMLLTLQMDPQLMEATNLLVECAFGKGDRLRIPARRAVVEVLVRENAFNPLFPQPHVQARDELLYVAFQQHIKIEGTELSSLRQGSHSCTPYVIGGHLILTEKLYS